jgi:hypothetical protein
MFGPAHMGPYVGKEMEASVLFSLLSNGTLHVLTTARSHEKIGAAAGLGSGPAGDRSAVTERLCGDPRQCATILTLAFMLEIFYCTS